MNKLFVGNLPFSMNDDSLGALFGQFGEVTSANVVIDRFSGRSRGFGFVEMKTSEGAQKAIEGLDGSEHAQRNIRVSLAESKPKTERSGGGGGDRFSRGGGGGGGFNRGGGGGGGKGRSSYQDRH